jgi:hypothetical protein
MAEAKARLGYDRGGASGHWWIELDDGVSPKKYGSFEPQDASPLGWAAASGLTPGTPADGKFTDDDPTLKKKRDATYATVPISPEGYSSAVARIEALKNDKQLDYNAFGPNTNECLTVTQDIFRAAGRPEHIADFFPTSDLLQSAAGRRALSQIAPRPDDLRGAGTMEFPDAAFPWPQHPKWGSTSNPTGSAVSEPAANHFNSEQAPSGPSARNLFNSDQRSENLLNSTPERFRAVRY